MFMRDPFWFHHKMFRPWTFHWVTLQCIGMHWKGLRQPNVQNSKSRYLVSYSFQQQSLYFVFSRMLAYLVYYSLLCNIRVNILSFWGCSHEGDGGPWQRWFIALLLTTITMKITTNKHHNWRWKLPFSLPRSYMPITKTMFKTHSGEWMLNIKNVKHSDAGNYECQVI